MECNKSRNLKMCNCTFSCDKKGVCCDCLKYHRDRNELPACYFSKEQEATGNRSIEYYIECNS